MLRSKLEPLVPPPVVVEVAVPQLLLSLLPSSAIHTKFKNCCPGNVCVILAWKEIVLVDHAGIVHPVHIRIWNPPGATVTLG